MNTSDGNAPGSQPAHFEQGRAGDAHLGGGDTIDPGRQPDEVAPGEGDTDRPGRAPDEVAPGQGDFDNPDNAPSEVPEQPDTGPIETPPPD